MIMLVIYFQSCFICQLWEAGPHIPMPQSDCWNLQPPDGLSLISQSCWVKGVNISIPLSDVFQSTRTGIRRFSSIWRSAAARPSTCSTLYFRSSSCRLQLQPCFYFRRMLVRRWACPSPCCWPTLCTCQSSQIVFRRRPSRYGWLVQTCLFIILPELLFIGFSNVNGDL